MNPYNFLNERKRERQTLTWAHLYSVFHLNLNALIWKVFFIKARILRGGGGSIKVGVYRQKGHKLGGVIWDLESWVRYCSNEIFPSNFYQFLPNVTQVSVCFWRRQLLYLYQILTGTIQTGTWWVYSSDFIWKCIYEGQCVTIVGAFQHPQTAVRRLLISKEKKVWCCSVLSIQGPHVLSSHKRASFKFGIVLMLLPLELGLKVQKNNSENTVYSSHVDCLALKRQGNLFWSKCNLFSFGLNFLCLSRDPFPISKVIKTFAYCWQKRPVWMKSVKSRIIGPLFYCIRNNEFKVNFF